MKEKRVNIEDELAGMFGLTADAIGSQTFRFDSDMHRLIFAASEIMKKNIMGGWTYSGMHGDGTTLWQSPDGGHYARVTRDGAVDSEY